MTRAAYVTRQSDGLLTLNAYRDGSRILPTVTFPGHGAVTDPLAYADALLAAAGLVTVGSWQASPAGDLDYRITLET